MLLVSAGLPDLLSVIGRLGVSTGGWQAAGMNHASALLLWAAQASSSRAIT